MRWEWMLSGALALAGMVQSAPQGAGNAIVAPNAAEMTVSDDPPQGWEDPYDSLTWSRDVTIDGRRLIAERAIPTNCGPVPAHTPLEPVADARRNFAARKPGLFAETSGGMANSAIPGFSDGVTSRIDARITAMLGKYGFMHFDISDTCWALPQLYAVILPAYNRELVRLIDQADKTGPFAADLNNEVIEGDNIVNATRAK